MSRQIESKHQQALFQWIARAKSSIAQFPHLDMIFSTLNGARMTQTHARAMKRTGMRKGVPDIVLPVPRGGYHGLYIELKITKTTVVDGKEKVTKTYPTREQKEYIARLNSLGYKAVVCWGWQEARDAIVAYYEGEK